MAWRAHEMLITADVIIAAVTAVLGLVQILQPSSTSTAACWIVLGWPALFLPLHVLMTDISGFFFSLPWLWLDVLSLALGVADLDFGQSLGYLLAALLRLLTAYRRFSGADNGAADNGAADNGAADNGARPGSMEDRADYATPELRRLLHRRLRIVEHGRRLRGTDNGAADNGAADNGTADNGAADNGAADNGARPRRMENRADYATPELRQLLERRLRIVELEAARNDAALNDARDLRNFFRDSGRETSSGITSAELQQLLAQLPDRLRRQLNTRMPLLQRLGDMLVEVEGTIIFDKLLDAFRAEKFFAGRFPNPPTRMQFKRGLETVSQDIHLFGFSLQLLQNCVDEVEADEGSDRFSPEALLLGLMKFQHRLLTPFVVTCEVVDDKLLMTNVAGDTHVLSQQNEMPLSKATVQAEVEKLYSLEEGRRLKFLVGHEEVDIAQLASSLLRKQSGRAA